MNTIYDADFYLGQMETSYESARIIVPYVLTLFPIASVIDVGCGVGTWLRAFTESGVREVVGVDGQYVDKKLLQIPPAAFIEHDLTRPLRLDRKFDLAVSLEVAEHLEQRSAETFVETLVALAPAVMFSAAIPQQGGTGHVNEQWQEYWARIFARHGYVPIDAVRKKFWSETAVQRFYLQNLLLYVSLELLDKFKKLARLREATCDELLSVVHPRQHDLDLLRRKPLPFEELGTLEILRAIPRVARASLSRRVARFVSTREKSSK